MDLNLFSIIIPPPHFFSINVLVIYQSISDFASTMSAEMCLLVY